MSHMYPPTPNGPLHSTAGGHMTCFLYIPKASVGAVIGSKGSFINHVKQESRASCQVQESPTDDPESSERPVKITGYPECVWKVRWTLSWSLKVVVSTWFCVDFLIGSSLSWDNFLMPNQTVLPLGSSSFVSRVRVRYRFRCRWGALSWQRQSNDY